jgi:hypothetical protein
MKRFLLLSCSLLTVAGLSFAQNEEDVLRYSFQKLNGTARSLGMGGTSLASGGDFSSAFSNPAGLAVFRQNQYQIGLGVNNVNTRSSYINQPDKGVKTNLNIPGMSAVFTHIVLDKGKEKKSGLINYSFSIGLNRMNSFHRKISIRGNNSSSSIMDYFAERANGYSAQDLGPDFSSMEGLAWNTYLINEDPQSPYAYMANLPDSILMKQKGEISTSGRINEFNLGMGLNFSHTVFLGFSLSMNTLRHENRSVWEEESGSFFPVPHQMKYEFGYTISGTGFTGRVGAIVRINDYIRAGLAYQTGTKYTIDDYFYNNMSSSEFAGPGIVHSYNSDLYNTSYISRAPSRLSGGISFFWPKTAFLNVELESVNYSEGFLNSAVRSFVVENSNVVNYFKKAINFKSGAEALYGPYRFRAGYALFGQPFKEEYSSEINLAVSNYTLGLGYKSRSGFFADLAFVYQKYKDFYTPYTLENRSRNSYTSLNNTTSTYFNLSVGSVF